MDTPFHSQKFASGLPTSRPVLRLRHSLTKEAIMDTSPRDSRLAQQPINADAEDALSPAKERRERAEEGGQRVGNSTPVDGPVVSPPAADERDDRHASSDT